MGEAALIPNLVVLIGTATLVVACVYGLRRNDRAGRTASIALLCGSVLSCVWLLRNLDVPAGGSQVLAVWVAAGGVFLTVKCAVDVWRFRTTAAPQVIGVLVVGAVLGLISFAAAAVWFGSAGWTGSAASPLVITPGIPLVAASVAATAAGALDERERRRGWPAELVLEDAANGARVRCAIHRRLRRAPMSGQTQQTISGVMFARGAVFSPDGVDIWLHYDSGVLGSFLVTNLSSPNVSITATASVPNDELVGEVVVTDRTKRPGSGLGVRSCRISAEDRSSPNAPLVGLLRTLRDPEVRGRRAAAWSPPSDFSVRGAES